LSEDARIADSLAGVRARMDAAAQRAGRRPDEVVLVGVAKRKAAEHVAAAVRAGLRDIGENYVQEAAEKIPKVNAILETGGHKSPRWHFIGRLQRNKAGTVARAFDRVETVDRSALGTALNERAADRSDPLEVLIQVNLSGESQKGGVAPEAALELLAASRAWPRLRLIGLMAVPAATDDPERSRPASGSRGPGAGFPVSMAARGRRRAYTCVGADYNSEEIHIRSARLRAARP
jgi:pyridoxal phosphate enzyme (YggS family)